MKLPYGAGMEIAFCFLGVPSPAFGGSGRVLRSNGCAITAAPAHAGCDAKNLEGFENLLVNQFPANAPLITTINQDSNSHLSQIRPLLKADIFPARGGRKFAEEL
jgi:hypothetical protein